MSLANKYPCALVSLFLTGCAADAEPELERADPEKREACAERAESQAFDQAADVSVTGSLLYAGQSLWSVPVVSPNGPFFIIGCRSRRDIRSKARVGCAEVPTARQKDFVICTVACGSKPRF